MAWHWAGAESPTSWAALHSDAQHLAQAEHQLRPLERYAAEENVACGSYRM
jgi:carbonic anhydrase